MNTPVNTPGNPRWLAATEVYTGTLVSVAHKKRQRAYEDRSDDKDGSMYLFTLDNEEGDKVGVVYFFRLREITEANVLGIFELLDPERVEELRAYFYAWPYDHPHTLAMLNELVGLRFTITTTSKNTKAHPEKSYTIYDWRRAY